MGDLAGTFLDYAGSQMEEEMTTVSLRPFLNGTWDDDQNEYREYVSSGLHKWRAVIQDINDTVTWKLICCKGQCGDRKFKEVDDVVELLFNVKEDLHEKKNVIAHHHDVRNRMSKLLPPGFCNDVTPAPAMTEVPTMVTNNHTMGMATIPTMATDNRTMATL